jgi:hypothetical protein
LRECNEKPSKSVNAINHKLKQMKTSILLLFGCFLLIIACKKEHQQVDGNLTDVTLYSCNGDVNSSFPYVCFDSLITDSRCPANAECFWSGYALIKVSFHENGNTHVFNMSTINRLGGVSDTIINGYKVAFSALNPYPGTTNGTVSNNDIKATINITQ